MSGIFYIVVIIVSFANDGTFTRTSSVQEVPVMNEMKKNAVSLQNLFPTGWHGYVRNKGNPDLVCEKNINHTIKPGLNMISYIQ